MNQCQYGLSKISVPKITIGWILLNDGRPFDSGIYKKIVGVPPSLSNANKKNMVIPIDSSMVSCLSTLDLWRRNQGLLWPTVTGHPCKRRLPLARFIDMKDLMPGRYGMDWYGTVSSHKV